MNEPNDGYSASGHTGSEVAKCGLHLLVHGSGQKQAWSLPARQDIKHVDRCARESCLIRVLECSMGL